MKFSTIIWGGGNPGSPESPESILNLAHLYRYFKNIHHEWHILVLANYDNYLHIKEPLAELNCHLIDLTHLFDTYYHRYNHVYNLYLNGKYPAEIQFKNTVRLLIAHEYFGGEPFLNTDADLIINDEPNSIVPQNKSLYMGSTCFIHIQDKNFADMYSELINEMVSDTDSYIKSFKNLAAQYHPGQNVWCINGPQPYNMGILEEGLFYALLLRNNLDWKSTNSYLHIPFVYDLYENLSNPTWKRISPLKNLHNEYQFTNTKHYINNKPLAYMHYQSNFRFILSFYILQKALNIPAESMYCPAMAEDMTPSRHDITNIAKEHCAAIQQNQKKYRHARYNYNFVPDIMLCQLMNNNKDKPLFGVDTFSYQHILDIERNGSLRDIFNNYFWYGENIFI